jgi:hypothetical protein
LLEDILFDLRIAIPMNVVRLHMGAHPIATYKSLEGKPGLRVVFFRSVLPKQFRFLQWIVASYEGLIRIDLASMLPDVFLTLMQQSMVAAYFMSTELETTFVRTVSERGRGFIDFGIKSDPGYSIYMVDADSGDVRTGIVEIVSYGLKVTPDLMPAVQNGPMQQSVD